MSNEIEPLTDPGLPHHVHRKADTDPKAEKRAERQVSILFLLSTLGTLLFIYSFIFIPTDIFVFLPLLGNVNAHNLGIGAGLGLALFFIGAGAVHWAKTLMPDEEVIAHRHPMRSSDEDRASFVETVKAEAGKVQLGRRSMIKRTLGLALGLVGLSPIILLRDLGPLPEQRLLKTTWNTGVRIVTDPGNRPIRPEDLEVGAIAHVLPEIKDPEHRKLSDIGKDAAILIRVRPSELKLSAERMAWTHEGIIAFSKICSHMGCPVALYEQQTKHLLCPCHQSTFDVPTGAKVIFGPAARPLPQLSITVDSEGYLVAAAPFSEPVGPSFWERNI
ncbi:MAG: Rieske (2Fe-2S) protein [Actinobacteria bacterium]|uniref:Rieske iron-sulfur protein n=1 Tax=Candidatus Fonsibacter lacus TaxID=2576439 RepID=A0A965LKE4_9PROT|nr:Rieske (2Fe-2S) protein [Candidatus Fonsibacter lacus]